MSNKRQGKWLAVTLVILATASGPISARSSDDKNKTPGVEFITVEELKAKVSGEQQITIIDVRTSETYASSTTRIKGAMHVNLRKLKARLALPPLKDMPRDREVVTYCACPSEESSIAAAKVFMESGFKHVHALKGGWQEWLKANGQVEPRPR
jgi:rhodanese-related sulfurtransferase